MNIQKDDRIPLFTRIVSGLVTPFLLLAFQILYFAAQTSGERFAWEIQPAMMAAFMGAGYLTGAYFFLNVIFRKEWHRVRVVFPAIAFFTFSMLLATLLHWARFDIRHAPFLAWLILYILTPALITFLWFQNDQSDPLTLEHGDINVPDPMRLIVRWIGIILALVMVTSFLAPQLLIKTWPWELTPLTARVTSGWISLIGFGSLFLAAEKRWSSWQLPLEVIAIWEILILIGGVLYREDLKHGWLNWLFISIVLQLIILIAFYINMQMRRRSLMSRKGNS